MDTSNAIWVGTENPLASIPLIVGKKGVAQLLGIPLNTVKDLRQESLAAIRNGEVTTATLPECDWVIDDRPLWFSRTIAQYACTSGRHLAPRVAQQLLEHSPEPVPLMCQALIAAFFEVPVKTVRERWRNKYSKALRNGTKAPASALVAEDFDVEGVMLWFPETIVAWGKQTGKLSEDGTLRERKGSRWLAPAPGPASETEDPLEALIRKGELWTRARIAEFFGVKETTVVMWGSAWSSGRNFPQADARTHNGTLLWVPASVLRWGQIEGRITEAGEVIRSVGGRPAKAAAA